MRREYKNYERFHSAAFQEQTTPISLKTTQNVKDIFSLHGLTA